MEESAIKQIPKPTGKRSLPKNAKPPKGEVSLYFHEIKDKSVGNLLLKSSPKGAPAWWEDVLKVEKLIDALKLHCTLTEALIYAGITRNQYYYFLEQHPDFSYIKEACEAILVLKARQNVAKRVETDAGASFAFLQQYDEKKRRQQALDNAQPNAVILVDFGEPLPEELQALEDKPFEPPLEDEEDNND